MLARGEPRLSQVRARWSVLGVACRLVRAGRDDAAIDVLRRPAGRGHPDARYALGYILCFGDPAVRSPHRGWQWLRRAARAGQADAMACLALTRWAQGQLIYYELPREAQDWRRLRHAARRGSAEAQHVLAGASAAGRGLACDRTRARYWYRRAATCGLPEAMYSLGMMCLIGEGGGRDGREARYWLTACARRGEAAWPHAGFAADVLASIHAGNPEPELADQAARAYWEGVAERLNGMGDADSDRLK